jgi:hypothetical protein
MKQLTFFTAVILIVAISGCNKNRVKSPEKVFERYEDHQAAKYYSLPPSIANKVIPEEENTQEMKNVLKEINHLKVLVLDGSNEGLAAFADVEKQLHSYVRQTEMKEMIRIIRNGEQISVHLREEDGSLEEVLINIHGKDGFKGVTIEGNLTFENIIKFIEKSNLKHLDRLIEP